MPDFSPARQSRPPPFVCFQLKEKSQACGGNLGSIEELRGAIYLAEEACPGISDTMVAQLVQRLQRCVPTLQARGRSTSLVG